MSVIKTKEEITLIHEGGKKLHAILAQVAGMVKPGVSTGDLNRAAERLIVEAGGRPSFKGYGKPPYPAGLCTSVNSEVVHGIPHDDLILEEGDIIGLDIGMQYPANGGLYTDMAVTVPVGDVSPEAMKLITVTRDVLDKALALVRPGIDLQDISRFIQTYVEGNGFGIVRDLVGHGVGHGVHEEPQVPNFVIPSYHLILKPGMVLAFEPMVTAGDYEVVTLDDEWTIETQDRSLSAHFEHTVAVTEEGSIILTKP
jgi:methionyl aminopeptidase